MNVVFMGTPEFSVAALDAIVRAGHNVICVYTRAPKPAGRGMLLHKSAVHEYAEAHNIPVRTPKSLKKDEAARAEFAALKADVAVVAAYGLILPQDVLDAPKHGCLNIHASLLPRWRGAAPIQRAIMAGDKETGICIMQMEAGLDTGPVLLRDTVPITVHTNATLLHDALAEMGGLLIVEALAKIETLPRETQTEEGTTYAHMLTKDDGRIDWTKSAEEIERQLRAFTPWPGVWCMNKEHRLKIHAVEIVERNGAPGEILDRHLIVACGKGALLLTSVQPEGKKQMSGVDFMNGTHMNVGDLLS